MNIGIDVDGVLVDMASYQLRYGAKYFKKRNKSIVNPKAYDVKEIFDCTNKEREKFWFIYIWRYCLKEPMTKNASEVVRRLRSQGNRIVLITGRAHTTEKGITGKVFRWMLVHWLKKNRLKYDEICFCSEKESADDKKKICIDKRIDVLIDDKVENLMAVKNDVQIICYPAVWNEDCRELDEYRVRDFPDILSKLS